MASSIDYRAYTHLCAPSIISSSNVVSLIFLEKELQAKQAAAALCCTISRSSYVCAWVCEKHTVNRGEFCNGSYIAM